MPVPGTGWCVSVTIFVSLNRTTISSPLCSYDPSVPYLVGTIRKIDEVMAAAKRAKEAGSTRFCMGAAWRELGNKKKAFNNILDMVSQRSLDVWCKRAHRCNDGFCASFHCFACQFGFSFYSK